MRVRDWLIELHSALPLGHRPAPEMHLHLVGSDRVRKSVMFRFTFWNHELGAAFVTEGATYIVHYLPVSAWESGLQSGMRRTNEQFIEPLVVVTDLLHDVRFYASSRLGRSHAATKMSILRAEGLHR